VLQCDAVCSVVANIWMRYVIHMNASLQCVAVCCGVLQCVVS